MNFVYPFFIFFCSNLGMLSDMGVNDCLFNQFNWYVTVKGSVFRLYKKHVFVRHYLTEIWKQMVYWNYWSHLMCAIKCVTAWHFGPSGWLHHEYLTGVDHVGW